jgi:hypothetical protein
MTRKAPQFVFVLEIFKEDGTHVGSYPVETDWSHVRECARFKAVRHDPARPLVLEDASGWVEPVWDPDAGEPCVAAVRAMVANNGGGAAAFDLPLTYFTGLARLESAKLVKSGLLEKGEKFKYAVCAYPVEVPAEAEPQGSTLRFKVESVAAEVPLPERAFAPLLKKAVARGRIGEDDMPVFIRRRVIDETLALTTQARCHETGGILIGRLYRQRDPQCDIGAEVTAQIPATAVEADSASLAFTPDTWAAVDAAIRLRRSDEMYLGWWHSHPSKEWCKDCPPEKRAKCSLSGDFFSYQDVALHRTVFYRAYSVALVISDSEAKGLTSHLFGWRHGQVASRGFYVLEDAK